MVSKPRSARARRQKNRAHVSSQQTPDPRAADQSLSVCAPMYKPELFGHPHEQAEEQITEPFHWQYPNWARPDYQLYYYPGCGFFDHPLYTSHTLDGRVQVVSYGTGRFNKPPDAEPAGPPPKRPVAEMVEIYYLDEFMGELPLGVLTRFSNVARIRFAEKGKRWGKRQDTKAEKHSTPNSSTVDSVLDGGTLDTTADCEVSPEDVSLPSSRTPSTARRRSSTTERSRANTKSTEITIPDDSSTSPSDGKPTPPHRTSMRGKKKRRGKKRELRLDLDVVEMPRKEAVLYAMAWMRDNALNNELLLPYGPSDITKVPFEYLIDLYQTALAFGLQPWPTRLRRELYERITRMWLNLDAFRNITNWLPLEDSCVARAINTFDDHVHRESYYPAEIDEFERFLDRPGNEVLKVRVDELRVLRQRNRDYLRNRRLYGGYQTGQTEDEESNGNDEPGEEDQEADLQLPARFTARGCCC